MYLIPNIIKGLHFLLHTKCVQIVKNTKKQRLEKTLPIYKDFLKNCRDSINVIAPIAYVLIHMILLYCVISTKIC